MKVLVLGGTKFFGKRLTEKLVASGHEVFVGSRGNAAIPSGAQHIHIDRDNKESLQVLSGHYWDIVYDQICYSSKNAQDLTEALWGQVGHIVYTSSMSVYPQQSNMPEEIFNPLDLELTIEKRDRSKYAEGKRLAEAYYFQKCATPVTAVRFPIVVGTDDYTQRFAFHFDRIKNGKEIYFKNLAAQMVFVDSDDAAEFLKWCAQEKPVGPINAASPEPISMGSLMSLIENQCKKKMKLAEHPSETNHSPYGIENNWYMNMSKAQSLGYKFKSLESWLNPLIQNWT